MIRKRRITTFLTVCFILALSIFLSVFPYLKRQSVSFLEDTLNAAENYPDYNDFICFTDESLGNCSIIISNGKCFLINCGYENTAHELIKQLKELNISAINGIIVTHPAARTCGGFDKISKEMTIEHLYICGVFKIDPNNDTDLLNLVGKADELHIPTRYINSDCSFPLEDAKVDIFCQPKENSRKSDNAPAIKVTLKNKSFLFINELSQQGELFLTQKNISSDALIVSGVMNYEGVSEDIIELIDPKTVIMSVGSSGNAEFENKFCKLSLDKGIRIYKTSILGNIYISSENSDQIFYFKN